MVYSPARINLIGEHTDYNEGFVLPAAIDKAMIFAVAPSGSDLCTIMALDLDDTFEFRIHSLEKTKKEWANYILGVVQQIARLNLEVKGFNCAFGGDIPVGAGLSSSAALACGSGFALNELFDLGIARHGLARIAQRAEHQFVGVHCGIMDQFANLFGKENHVLMLDCRTQEFGYHLFDRDDIGIVLCHTRISHALAASEYNVRRQECEQGVRFLQNVYPQVRSLRDVSMAMLNERKSEMGIEIYRRCEYVIHENDRVVAACEALKSGNLQILGMKMFETHAGLRDHYQVSCAELDFLAEFARKKAGILGARMMGGGFGGCTINLVSRDAIGDFSDEIQFEYQSKFAGELEVYQVKIGPGTSIIHWDA